MIDFFSTWLPTLIGYAELIAEEQGLRNAWLHRDTTGTPIASYEELAIQILDDMDSRSMRSELGVHLVDHPSLKRELEDFLDGLVALDTWVEASSCDDREILKSDQWRHLRESAGRVVSVANRHGYESSEIG